MAKKLKSFTSLAGLLMLTAICAVAQTAVIFVADKDGNVGRILAGDSTGSFIGSISSSEISPSINSQILGLAYDSTSNGILLFDRGDSIVYSMNATTGVTSVLFSTPDVVLQGGAIYGGLIYGMDENTETLKAFSFEGVEQTLTHNAKLTTHNHSLGMNPDTGAFIYMQENVGVRTIHSDGREGDLILSASTFGSAEDIGYFDGDYLLAKYDRQLYFLDGETGVSSAYLTDSELAGMGVTGPVTGVVLQYATVPEPSTWALMLVGLITVGWISYRRKTA